MGKKKFNEIVWSCEEDAGKAIDRKCIKVVAVGIAGRGRPHVLGGERGMILEWRK